jgi:hypothetical protein
MASMDDIPGAAGHAGGTLLPRSFAIKSFANNKSCKQKKGWSMKRIERKKDRNFACTPTSPQLLVLVSGLGRLIASKSEVAIVIVLVLALKLR